MSEDDQNSQETQPEPVADVVAEPDISAEDPDAQPVGEMRDRYELKILKKKAKEQARKDKRDAIDLELKSSAHVGGQKKKQRKKIIIGSVIVVVVVLGLLFRNMIAPTVLKPQFGVCLVFLELQLPFPETFRYTSVRPSKGSWRIYYVHTDAFGEYRSQQAECYFKRDEASRYQVLDRVTIDRREVDPRKVNSFNRSIAVVYKNLPDLRYIPSKQDRLEGLVVDTDSIRQPLF